MTNTNWQAYSGESALSYFSQAIGLTVLNFGHMLAEGPTGEVLNNPQVIAAYLGE